MDKAKGKYGFDLMEEARAAAQRIKPYARLTPLEYAPYLSEEGENRVYLKLENYQVSGSFKYRGVLNKLLTLDQETRNKGVITASTGNHAAAFTMAARTTGSRGIVYVPETLAPAKKANLEALKAQMEFYGHDAAQTETHARQQALSRGLPFISPYNDPQIISGQATVALEMVKQLENPNVVLVPVGGGGLMGGISGYLKATRPGIHIIGCQPVNSPVMAESVKAGHIITMKSFPTLADGTAGGIEPGAVTFDICRDMVDEFVLVDEEEIKRALLLILDKHQVLIEGAAALSVAAWLKIAPEYKNKNVVLVLSGKRIGLTALKSLII